MKSRMILFLLCMILMLSLAACTPKEAAETLPEPVAETEEVEQEEQDASPEPTDVPPTEAAPTEPPATETAEPTSEPTQEPLPAQPQPIQFEASDGQTLEGMYYPAAVSPAPIVILMHWAPGDMDDWVEIAYWLQNRGMGGQTDPVETWLDPSWFPLLADGESYAVFTFTFRGCDGGCSSFLPEGWLLDAQAAMQTAMSLEGVDPSRMLSAGASIGADGAPDGCLWLNENTDASCLGAYSFSPGSYLTIAYADAVNSLEALEPPVPVHCLYGVDDGESSVACESAGGANYQMFSWPGSPHGMMLIDPALEPNALEKFYMFVNEHLGK